MNHLEFVFKFCNVHGTMYYVHDFWLYICLLSCKNKIDTLIPKWTRIISIEHINIRLDLIVYIEH